MHPQFTQLLTDAKLTRCADVLTGMALPAAGFSLEPDASGLPAGSSRLGGRPDLPDGFSWPTCKKRPLDFLLQINLAEARLTGMAASLPDAGLLSFFYDLEEQPWGFDPRELDGFRVVYTPATGNLSSHDLPNADFELPSCAISFHDMMTLPYYGSRAAEALTVAAQFTEDEQDAYFEFPAQLEDLYGSAARGGNHHLLGHSANVQGDMQLEAQLVTNGIYCGDSTGYQDPRREVLEPATDDWILLLQLDSDDSADIMWGDCGMLYYWIRKDDLAARQFSNVWMGLQCC